MEPSTPSFRSLKDIISSIEGDIASLRSLNGIRPKESVIFDGRTYTFSTEKGQKKLHLHLPASKELQDMRPSSPKRIVTNLQKIHARINNDILEIGRYILKKLSKDDLVAMQELKKQLLSLNAELAKSISANKGIDTMTHAFKKQTEFQDSVQQIHKIFEDLKEAAKAIQDNLSDILNPGPLTLSLSLEDDDIGRLPTIREENEEEEIYDYPSAPYVGDIPEKPENDYFDDESLEDDFEDNPIAKDPFDNDELFRYFDLPSNNKSGAKDPFDNDELFQHFDLPSSNRSALEDDTSWPESEKVKDLRSDSNEIQSVLAKASENPDKVQASAQNKPQPKGSVLSALHLSLKTINSWRVFTGTNGQEFCLIKISETAFVNIPVTGKNSTPLEVIKKKYHLKDDHQMKS